MTSSQGSPGTRKPRVFEIDDVEDADPETESLDAGPVSSRRGAVPERTLTTEDLKRGFRFGGIVLSAVAALASIAAGLWFTRFVSIAIERQDWIGWVSFGLLCIVGAAIVITLLRELVGFRRLARLSRLRTLVTASIANKDIKGERRAVASLLAHYRGRPDLAWGVARVKEHTGDVLEQGELLRLADRELLARLDVEARRNILKSAKRVATVTALSPILWIGVIYVLVENVRMFRALAGIYGGRPGVLGAMRLGRLVVAHVIATGGIAMTDDLLGQFVGQDLLRRLSRRLGEGAFNGSLTARLGVVAVEVTRPLPYLDAEPLRVREIFAELLRSLRGSAEPNRTR